MKRLEHNTSKEVLRAGDGCLSGAFLGLIVVVVILCYILGCSTCPPCQDRVEAVEVQVPVYSCPEVPDIGQVSLPPYPQLHPDATDEQLKEFYASLAHTVRSRDSVQSNYIQYLLSLLEPYRTP